MRVRSIVVAAAGACLVLSLAGAPASAATFKEETPYSQSAFAAAQKANQPILVHVTAPWCSTCTAQKPIVDRLHAEPAFSNYKVFNVDFDTQKPLLRKLGVRMQSTLIVYKGATEEGRSSGDTDAGAIKALLERAE